MPSLRPTPNRIRETVFNWLANKLPDAQCLDAFAGSGALGFEALSRGAAAVTLLDQATLASAALEHNKTLLGAATAHIYQADFFNLAAWHQPKQVFDIVFLDPPYHDELLWPSFMLLEDTPLLATTAYIYAEHHQPITTWPPAWQCVKAKIAGQVHYYLFTR